MTAVEYAFDKINIARKKEYIFQHIRNRKLTAVYHAHDFYELIWFADGWGKQLLNAQECICESGTVTLLRPGDRHFFQDQSEEMRIISLSVRQEEFERICDIYDALLLQRIRAYAAPLQFPAVPGLMPSEDYYRDRQNVTEYDCKLLLALFLRSCIENTDCLGETRELPGQLAKAIDEMKKTENLRLGITAFEQLSHYSRSHLARLIRAHFGMSLKQYINEQRLRSAYNELILTYRPAEDISEELGFQSFSHFNKIFKERFAITPAALRKRHGTWTL